MERLAYYIKAFTVKGAYLMIKIHTVRRHIGNILLRFVSLTALSKMEGL